MVGFAQGLGQNYPSPGVIYYYVRMWKDCHIGVLEVDGGVLLDFGGAILRCMSLMCV